MRLDGECRLGEGGVLNIKKVIQMKMNLPNKLTILRICLVPFFVLFMLTNLGGSYHNVIAGIIFIAASITDTLDGYIARKYNMITVFGKFMDPLADKLLVCSAMICLVALDRIPAWVVIVIIAREFIISGFRLVAAQKGIVIAAGWSGKIKTVVQMVMVIVLVFDFGKSVYVLEQILIYASLVLTVVSLADYLTHNRGVLAEE